MTVKVVIKGHCIVKVELSWIIYKSVIKKLNKVILKVKRKSESKNNNNKFKEYQ